MHVEHLKETTHTHISNIDTLVFTWLNPLKREAIYDSNQHGHLGQYINAKIK
jgi:hypothetical protein